MDPAPATPAIPEHESIIRQFVGTPFSIRCGVVKVWRPLPDGFWTTLIKPEDTARARRAERLAVVSVLAIAAVLILVFSGIGVGTMQGDSYQLFPLVGKPSLAPTLGPGRLGWSFELWLSFSAVFWAVAPSLAGWAFVRMIWIPAVVRRNPARGPAMVMARHLGSVYLYVYVMILAGALLLLSIARVAPAETAFVRWCFWCFLFGESFFVPGVMWIRLALANGSAEVFGRFRHALLVGYITIFVAIPIYGMTFELG